MIKIYYDTNGTITNKIVSSFDFEHDLPHLTLEQDINIDHYKVNIDTLELQEIDPALWPKSSLDIDPRSRTL